MVKQAFTFGSRISAAGPELYARTLSPPATVQKSMIPLGHASEALTRLTKHGLGPTHTCSPYGKVGPSSRASEAVRFQKNHLTGARTTPHTLTHTQAARARFFSTPCGSHERSHRPSCLLYIARYSTVPRTPCPRQSHGQSHLGNIVVLQVT